MDYEDKLRDLKVAFVQGITLGSGVTVLRMMNVVQTIGRLHFLRLRQHTHGFGTKRNPST